MQYFNVYSLFALVITDTHTANLEMLSHLKIPVTHSDQISKLPVICIISKNIFVLHSLSWLKKTQDSFTSHSLQYKCNENIFPVGGDHTNATIESLVSSDTTPNDQ